MIFIYVNLNSLLFFFFFNDTATTEIYTLSLHDALPISYAEWEARAARWIWTDPGFVALLMGAMVVFFVARSEEHTSELQSQSNLVCRLLLEKKKKKNYIITITTNDNHTYIISILS